MNRILKSLLAGLTLLLSLAFMTGAVEALPRPAPDDAVRTMPVFVEDASGDRPGTDGAAMVAALKDQIAATPGLAVVEDPSQAAVTVMYFIWTTPFDTPPPETFRNYALVFTESMTTAGGAQLMKVQAGSEEGDFAGMHREAIHKLIDIRADLIAWQDANPVAPTQ